MGTLHGGDACAGGTCIPGDPVDCDDGNACTEDGCDASSGCTHGALTGVPCDDGSVCTEGDLCLDGQCLAGAPIDCGDGNPCTIDACDPTLGCTHEASTDPCDDGDACTTGDVCSDGACVGEPIDCDDGNGCTEDTCNPFVGCKHDKAPSGTPCDDGDPCTAADACQAGVCVGLAPTNCDDGSPCTKDTCDTAQGGCVHTAAGVTVPCDDGDKCTWGDTCAGVACKGKPVDCDDFNGCTVDACDPQTGCVHTPADGPCDDGDVCTEEDACIGGFCKGKPTTACDDGDPCTQDICDPMAGCASLPSAGPCEDGDPCTVGDTCTDGVCVPGPATNCDDGLPCTTDACDPDVGCTHTVAAGQCAIDGACWDAGTGPAGDACRSCDPAVDPTAWTVADTPTCKAAALCGFEQAGEEAGAPWPVPGYCSAHPGWTPATGVEPAAVAWSDGSTAATVGLAVGADGTTYAVDEGGALRAIDASGSVTWTVQTPALLAAPAVGPGPIVYAGGADDALHAFDGQTGEALWTAPAAGPVACTPALRGGILYWGADDGSVRGTTMQEGFFYWVVPLGSPVRGAVATGGPGWVVVPTEAGVVHALEADTGQPVWTYDAGAPVHVPVVAADGTVYVVAGGVLHAIAPDGTLAWANQVEAAIEPPVLTEAGRIVVVGASGALAGFEPDGQAAFAVDVPDTFAAPPAGDGAGTTYLAATSGAIYGVLPSGIVQWSASFDAAWTTAPVPVGGALHVGATDGVYRLVP
jgi:FOG: WD40-like repeat